MKSGVVGVLICAFLLSSFLIAAVKADSLVWTAQVFSSGVVVVSPALNNGTAYRIVAMDTWWYDVGANLAADAMYYTTDFSNNIFWGNHFPAPGGHSFLQINSQDVNWGPFSNGDTGHTYTIQWIGNGSAISFRIVDWIDGTYTNNVCHIHVSIYQEVAVGGTIANGMQALPVYFAVSTLIVAGALVAVFAKRVMR